MKREQKSSLISMVQEKLSSSNGIFVVENRGLSVKETEALRNALRPITHMFKVVKNRLMKRALDGTSFSTVADFLKKPTAVVLADDPFAVAKALAAFADSHPNLSIVGGHMDGNLLSQSEVLEISKLPSMDEIRGTIARILVEPASRLARVSAEYGKK